MSYTVSVDDFRRVMYAAPFSGATIILKDGRGFSTKNRYDFFGVDLDPGDGEGHPAVLIVDELVPFAEIALIRAGFDASVEWGAPVSAMVGAIQPGRKAARTTKTPKKG